MIYGRPTTITRLPDLGNGSCLLYLYIYFPQHLCYLHTAYLTITPLNILEALSMMKAETVLMVGYALSGSHREINCTTLKEAAKAKLPFDREQPRAGYNTSNRVLMILS